MGKGCVPEKVKHLRIPEFSEVRRHVLELYQKPVIIPKAVRRKAMVKFLTRVDWIYEYLDKIMDIVYQLPKTEELDKFHIEVLRIAGIEDYEDLLNKVRGHRKVLRNLWRDYRLKLKASMDPKEARKLTREFVGRALSVFKRLRKDIEIINDAVKLLKALPCLSKENPTVVIAGMPQVGKSTLVSKLSTAEPKISPFPFTTKEIIVGHKDLTLIKLQIVDTPGILDRPFHELNPIERKALAAIKYLSDVVVYLIDPHPGSYYPLKQQLSLLTNVLKIFPQNKVIVAINKIDTVDDKRLDEVKAEIRNAEPSVYVMEISALKEIGLDKLMEKILKILGLSPKHFLKT